MPGDLPWWVIFFLGLISGVLGTLAIGPTSDAFWAAVYIVRRWCLITGAVVLCGGTLFGICYLIYRAKFAPA
jgi:hypothetical protein